jgi:hypothetical protein
MIRVYIAGPMGKANVIDANVRASVPAAMALVKAGAAVYLPHIWHFADVIAAEQDIDRPEYAAWLAQDLEWVRASNVVLRLPGASPGAEREVAEAGRCHIPVFTDLAQLLALVSRWSACGLAPVSNEPR